MICTIWDDYALLDVTRYCKRSLETRIDDDARVIRLSSIRN